MRMVHVMTIILTKRPLEPLHFHFMLAQRRIWSWALRMIPCLVFFEKRAGYLIKHGMRESGILSNHKALIVLALYNVFLITAEERFRDEAKKKLTDLLEIQTSEGWFPEYEGCDPGYLMFTIDFLSKYFQKSGDNDVIKPLENAIKFNSYFLHPDGSFGGEYGSRNTHHYLPHGLELMGKQVPCALAMNNLFLKSLRNRKRSFLEDDRLVCHYTYNFLQAYRDFDASRKTDLLRKKETFIKYFKEAGLYVRAQDDLYFIVSIFKGGVLKAFKGDQLVASDTGIIGRTTGGKRFTSQMVQSREHLEEGDFIELEGECYDYKVHLFSPIKFIAFRFFSGFGLKVILFLYFSGKTERFPVMASL